MPYDQFLIRCELAQVQIFPEVLMERIPDLRFCKKFYDFLVDGCPQSDVLLLGVFPCLEVTFKLSASL